MLQSRDWTKQAIAKGSRVEDPATLVTLLKGGLFMIMAGAAIAIAREIVPMARGKVQPKANPTQPEE